MDRKKFIQSLAILPLASSAMKLEQLKELCRERSIPVSGIKSEIIQRLLQFDSKINSQESNQTKKVTTSYEDMKLEQLKEICRERTLPVSGNKSQLLERIAKFIFCPPSHTRNSLAPSSTCAFSTAFISSSAITANDFLYIVADNSLSLI